jgi:hypothetical protein
LLWVMVELAYIGNPFPVTVNFCDVDLVHRSIMAITKSE